MKIFIEIIKHDMRQAFSARGHVWQQLVLFISVMALFAFVMPKVAQISEQLALAAIWSFLLLVSTLSFVAMFAEDYRDGTLEQYLLLPIHPTSLVMAKIIAHFLSHIVVLLASIPVVFLWFGMHQAAMGNALVLLTFGTFIMTVIGSMSAAITLGARGGGSLLSLLVLPLNVPVLIFGIGSAISGEQSFHSGVITLTGLLLILLPLCLAIATAALAASMRQG